MRIDELERIGYDDLYLRAAAEVQSLWEGREALLDVSGSGEGMHLRIDGNPVPVEGLNESDRQVLQRFFQTELPRLLVVRAVDPVERKCGLRIFTFRRRLIRESLDFVVTTELLQSGVGRKSGPRTLPELTDFLTDEFVDAGTAGQPRIVMSGNGLPGKRYRLRLLGRQHFATCQRNTTGQLVIESLTRFPGHWQNSQPIMLVEAAVNFTDQQTASGVGTLEAAELEAGTRVDARYMALWQNYNRLAADYALQAAREFGTLRYTKRQLLDDGRYRLYPDLNEPGALARVQRLRGGMGVELAKTVPYQLLDEAKRDLGTASETGSRSRVFAGEIRSVAPDGEWVDLYALEHLKDDVPPQKGFLFHSISGDATSIRRRDEAMRMLLSGKTAMPDLLGILEGSFSVERQLSGRHTAMSPAARAAFRGAPTEQQRRAVEIALNTPDIALIQGPPGTGKTRVVAAIQARLAELAQGRDDIAGITLVTSYQHDAVENAASAIRVYNLPAVKIGRGSNRLTDSSSSNIERWAKAQLEHSEALLGELMAGKDGQVERALRRTRELFDTYLNRELSQVNAAQLVQEILSITRSVISPGVYGEVCAALDTLQSARVENADDEIRLMAREAVMGLRVTPAGFSDDGPDRARKALLLLKRAGAFDVQRDAVLQEAADCTSPETFDTGALRDLKTLLLDVVASDERPEGSPQAIEDADALARRIAQLVIGDLLQRAEEAFPSEASALARYAEDLELNPHRVEETIKKYSTVLAATCQQAVGYEMVSRKEGENFSFETVIVDEAARANPLDLLIPLTRAKQRIVLVGDHRQLPHMLEESVRRQLDDGGDQDALSQSLFERLFNQLRNRTDGITRVITLDTQYRMHPRLGTFVSRTFYEVHNQGEGFTNGLDEQHFRHDVSAFIGRVAAWHHVPLSEGREKRHRNGSVSRRCEAQIIADHVRKMLDEKTAMSIGIIAFYSAQVMEIWRALEERGIAREVEPDRFEIREEYRDLRDGGNEFREALRVGTVDAFQGKEFDVVFLSVVRSNTLPEDTPQALNRRYGHLRLANRLCVAMSRQKRLLVVVGDRAMVSAHVPEMQALLGLCQEGEYEVHA